MYWFINISDISYFISVCLGNLNIGILEVLPYGYVLSVVLVTLGVIYHMSRRKILDNAHKILTGKPQVLLSEVKCNLL